MKPDLDIPFQELLDALLDEKKTLQARFLFRLSDLGGGDLEELNAIWDKITIIRRQKLLEDLEMLAESNYLLLFDAVYRLALQGEDPLVRTLGIRAFWGSDEKDLISIFLDFLENDKDTNVRAQAASSLGHYIYLGELEELDEAHWKPIEENLINVLESDDHPSVRKRALESLGFSSRSIIQTHIIEAYELGDEEWVVSALLAMSRSASVEWVPYILDKVENPNTEIRAMAAKAAGELGLEDAKPALLIFLEEEENDEVRMAAAWALSEITGEGVQDGLERLLESAENEDEIDLLESAIENLAFNEEIQSFDLFDFSDQDIGDFIDSSENGESPD
ncbi:MAG: HEAT repeat domain-containing protein [Chloroflexi bacterium]|nr:HEAT repeat domain-containing protein [Chloroflexota bacterium]